MNSFAGEVNALVNHRYGVRGELVWKHSPLSEENLATTGTGTILSAADLKGYSLYLEAWFWLWATTTSSATSRASSRCCGTRSSACGRFRTASWRRFATSTSTRISRRALARRRWAKRRSARRRSPSRSHPVVRRRRAHAQPRRRLRHRCSPGVHQLDQPGSLLPRVVPSHAPMVPSSPASRHVRSVQRLHRCGRARAAFCGPARGSTQRGGAAAC